MCMTTAQRGSLAGVPGTDKLELQLARAGVRLARHREGEKTTLQELRALAREAHAAGMPKTQIAALARVSRVTVDAMLRDE